MSAVSIGPEHTKWGEGDYSWDVTVEKNVFRHNALGNKGAEVVFLHGDGGIGNRRIKIVDNVFDATYGTCVGVNWTDGAEVTGNTVRAASPLGAAEKGYFADISHARNVTVKGNTMPVAAGDVEPVSVGEDVVGVVKA